MAKKIKRIAKLQLKAGQAKPGPELAGLGIDMAGFTRAYNDATKDRAGDVVPVVITAYDDRSFAFVLKTTPTSNLIKKAAKLESASKKPPHDIVGEITIKQVEEIAKYKLVDMNGEKLESAMKQVKGTARNMGIKIVE